MLRVLDDDNCSSMYHGAHGAVSLLVRAAATMPRREEMRPRRVRSKGSAQFRAQSGSKTEIKVPGRRGERKARSLKGEGMVADLQGGQKAPYLEEVRESAESDDESLQRFAADQSLKRLPIWMPRLANLWNLQSLVTPVSCDQRGAVSRVSSAEVDERPFQRTPGLGRVAMRCADEP